MHYSNIAEKKIKTKINLVSIYIGEWVRFHCHFPVEIRSSNCVKKKKVYEGKEIIRHMSYICACGDIHF